MSEGDIDGTCAKFSAKLRFDIEQYMQLTKSEFEMARRTEACIS